LPESTIHGGAVYHNGGIAEILRCCFLEDASDEFGNAIHFQCEEPCLVSDSSFVKCKDHDESSWGGIYSEGDGDISLIGLNFSDCVLSRNNDLCLGAVLLWDKDGGWTFSHCTVVRCGGGSGLEYRAQTGSLVELTNFWNNSCSASGGVLSGDSVGFEVHHCIFWGNTQELHITSLNAMRPKFWVTNCVFSGSLPAGNIYNQNVNNTVGTPTASFAHVHFATAVCPNLLPAEGIFTNVRRLPLTSSRIYIITNCTGTNLCCPFS
jgi:hypothetical protein